ncbi:hypothetical protein [Streptomyces cadmiisoli]
MDHGPPRGVEIPTMQGFRVSFLIATAAVAIGLALALCLPRQPRAADKG